jgi:hypothetical protein
MDWAAFASSVRISFLGFDISLLIREVKDSLYSVLHSISYAKKVITDKILNRKEGPG